MFAVLQGYQKYLEKIWMSAGFVGQELVKKSGDAKEKDSELCVGLFLEW